MHWADAAINRENAIMGMRSVYLLGGLIVLNLLHTPYGGQWWALFSVDKQEEVAVRRRADDDVLICGHRIPIAFIHDAICKL